eukprot:182104_1
MFYILYVILFQLILMTWKNGYPPEYIALRHTVDIEMNANDKNVIFTVDIKEDYNALRPHEPGCYVWCVAINKKCNFNAIGIKQNRQYINPSNVLAQYEKNILAYNNHTKYIHIHIHNNSVGCVYNIH